MLQAIQNLQGGVSGVDLNEEAANLVRFQTAYAASAQLTSTIDTLFQYSLISFRRFMTIRLNPDLLPGLLTSLQQATQNETTVSLEMATGRA